MSLAALFSLCRADKPISYIEASFASSILDEVDRYILFLTDEKFIRRTGSLTILFEDGRIEKKVIERDY